MSDKKLKKFIKILKDPKHPKQEKTLVLIKPDAVKRGLIGEIIKCFEIRGLKVVALKLFKSDKKTLKKHYPNNKKFILNLGKKSLESYKKYNLDPIKELGTDNPEKIGRMVRGWLVDFMVSGPVVKMVLEGSHAVDVVRKIVGETQPAFAQVGTIRGDFQIESAGAANKDKRPIRNLVHASGNKAEAIEEILLWFNPDEICDYTRVEELI